MEQGKGRASFSDAVKELTDFPRLAAKGFIGGANLFEDSAFQDEVFAALKKDAPKELQGALKSAGNMHNPKMHELWDAFHKAAMNTSFIRDANTVLLPHGLHISHIGVEKFEPRKTDEGRRFFGIMYLTLTPVDAKPETGEVSATSLK